MAEYDADDLQSVLTYMRTRFGEGIFEEPPRMYAIMKDLSPKLKGARNVRELSEAGLCAELRVAIQSGARNEPARVLMKIKYWLTDNLDLSEDRAEYYVTALQAAYGLETQAQAKSPPQPAPAPIRQAPQQPKPAPQPPTKMKASIIKSGRTGLSTFHHQ